MHIVCNLRFFQVVAKSLHTQEIIWVFCTGDFNRSILRSGRLGFTSKQWTLKVIHGRWGRLRICGSRGYMGILCTFRSMFLLNLKLLLKKKSLFKKVIWVGIKQGNLGTNNKHLDPILTQIIVNIYWVFNYMIEAVLCVSHPIAKPAIGHLICSLLILPLVTKLSIFS